MKSKIILIAVIIFSLNAFCATPFSNLKEGASRFSKILNPIHERFLLSRYGKNGINKFLVETSLKKENYLCATNWVNSLRQSKFVGRNHQNKYVKSLILLMRKENIIDDIVTDILLKALRIREHFFLGISIPEQSIHFDKNKLQVFLKNNIKKFYNNCGEDGWKLLVSGFLKNNFTSANGIPIRKLLYYAKKHDYLSNIEFKVLNKFRSSDVLTWNLTLKEYYKKRRAIENKIKLDVTPSTFLTVLDKGGNRSIRQRLYESYSSFQIKLLSKVMVTMQKRFNAISASIDINYGDYNEKIKLSSMEKFRMNLKLMRKQLNDLNNLSVFKGNPATYIDIIAAAYEMNLVHGDEIKYLAKFQEIWNPKISKSQKIMSWVQNIGSIGALVLPEPFSFLTLMGLMIIDQKVQTPKVNLDKAYSIF